MVRLNKKKVVKKSTNRRSNVTKRKRPELLTSRASGMSKEQRASKRLELQERKIKLWEDQIVDNIDRVDFDDFTKRTVEFKNDEERDKSLFIKENVERLVELVEEGNTLEDAARLIYIDPLTVRNWYDDNRKNFKYAIDQAEAFQKMAQVNAVLKGKRNWTSAAWWLERRYRHEFNKDLTVQPPSSGDEQQFMKVGDKLVGF